MPYADYAFYKLTFIGDRIPEAEWLRLSVRASDWLDRLTFGRAASVTVEATLTLLGKATCAVAEELMQFDQAGGADGILAETVGSVSIEYSPHSSRQKPLEQRIEDAASTYLASTGLLFSGFKQGEYGVAT